MPVLVKRSSPVNRENVAATRRSATLHLSITARTGAPFVPYLRRHIANAHIILRSPLRELSLVLVGDARMSELHMRFMGLDCPTDVLTFPLEFDRRGRVTSGEVVICVPQAQRVARTGDSVDMAREVLLYALHGLLHLSGFDDRTPAGYRRMHATEDRTLTRLGIGPVFARPGGTSGGARR